MLTIARLMIREARVASRGESSFRGGRSPAILPASRSRSSSVLYSYLPPPFFNFHANCHHVRQMRFSYISRKEGNAVLRCYLIPPLANLELEQSKLMLPFLSSCSLQLSYLYNTRPPTVSFSQASPHSRG